MVRFLTIVSAIRFHSFGNDIQFQNLISAWLTIMICIAVVCFLISELSLNYSQVDKLWSLIPGIYAWITFATYQSPRVLVMAILVSVWGLRLSYNFYRKGGYSLIPWQGAEDYRWQVMRDHPALKGRLRFGLFNLIFISFYQNILILLFSSPLLLAAINHDKALSWIDLTAAAFMLLFIITESISDLQLYRFHQQKRGNVNPDGRFAVSIEKGFMSDGLWKYIRHPNFASEQAIWISFYFFGVAASGKLINPTVAGPVLLVLLFIGSTILTERISGSKYPDYADYKRSVPKFLPRIF